MKHPFMMCDYRPPKIDTRPSPPPSFWQRLFAIVLVLMIAMGLSYQAWASHPLLTPTPSISSGQIVPVVVPARGWQTTPYLVFDTPDGGKGKLQCGVIFDKSSNKE